jgi:hypothetical protein
MNLEKKKKSEKGERKAMKIPRKKNGFDEKSEIFLEPAGGRLKKKQPKTKKKKSDVRRPAAHAPCRTFGGRIFRN